MRKVDIPPSCTNIVIFVHGFGVRWDSRGMFTDVAKNLPKGWGSVAFDLYDNRSNQTYIKSINDQVNLVREIYTQILSKNPSTTIHLIAHSMGCVITAMTKIKPTGKVVLLAPPDTFGDGMLESYFRNYPGAQEGEQELIVPRKDGTITHIPYQFFTEMSSANPVDSLYQYSSIKDYILIQTTEDEVIGNTNFEIPEQSARIIQVPSDHNFTGKNREKLLETINKVLLS